MTNLFEKDISAKSDYTFDWSTWLASGETIATAVVTVPTELTLTGTTTNPATVIAWISGGTAEARYLVDCKITTTDGRIDARNLYISVKDR